MVFLAPYCKTPIYVLPQSSPDHREGWSVPPADSGFLLLTRCSRESAVADCTARGEQLWTPELKIREPPTKPLLPLIRECLSRQSKKKKNWIALSTAGLRAMNGKGQVVPVVPHLHLPVVCTSSALFSNASQHVTSPLLQVTMHSNNEYILLGISSSPLLFACADVFPDFEID